MYTSRYWVKVRRICRKRMLIWFGLLLAALLPAHVAAQIPTGYQDYYVLGYEEHVLDAFQKIRTLDDFPTCICSVVTLVATADGQVVYYDHWEDGYEADLRNPLQTTTEVYPLSSGDILALKSDGASGGATARNSCVPSDSRNPAYIRYDGRDRIFTSGGPVSMAHAMWPHDNTWIADSWENYPSQTYAGTYFYYTPVGKDLYNVGGAYKDFLQVFLQVAAFEKDTTVSIDNGAGQMVNVVLNQGDSYYSEGFINSQPAPAIAINAGTTIRTSKPVQVGVITGGSPGASTTGFQGRFYTLLPEPQWGADYTVLVPSDNTTEFHPTEIYIANPNDYPITVNAYDVGFPSGFSFPIASNQYLTATVPYSTKRGGYIPAGGRTSARLTSSDGVFGVLVAADTNNTNYDWGFAPVPNQYLTNNYYVSWAPGSDDLTWNGSPVWVAPVADNTTFYVDYGPNDGIVDRTFTLNALEQRFIRDYTDNDNTGMHVWATNKFAIAWGESMNAGYGDPYLDLGYTVLPVNEDWIDPVATFEKSVDPVVLPPSGGQATFTLVTQAHDVALTQVNISDTLPANWSYVLNSTTINGSPASDPSQAGQRLNWGPLPDMAAHETLILTFQAQIADTTGISRSVNYAQALTRDAIHNDALNPSDDATVYFSPLKLTKTVDRTTVGVNEMLVYNLTYTNLSNQIINDVAIQDVIPAYYVTLVNAPGGTFSEPSSTVRWRFASLDPYETGTLTLRVRVKDFLPNGTRIENTGYIYTDTVPTELLLVPSNVVRSIVQAPQISFFNSGPVVVSQGDLITYTLSYQNIGGMAATGVVVTNTIPALTQYIDNSMEFWNGSGWIPLTDAADGDIGRRIGNYLVVTPGNVDTGVAREIRYVVRVPASTPAGSNILNSAVLDRDRDIPRTSNTVVTHVSPLAVEKSATPAVSAPGGLITYTLVYTNHSSTVSQANVTVMDPVPTYTTFVAGSAGAEYSGDNGATWNSTPPPTVTNVRWVVPSLAAGASGALNLTVRVQPTLPPRTTIRNTAYISSSELMLFGNIMLDSEPTDIPTVDLHVVKTAAPTTATAGETVIAYTLTYSNSGSVDATAVQLLDKIPSGATYVPGSIGGAGAAANPPYLTWTLGTVPADLVTRQAGYQASVNPDFSGSVLTNTATIRNALMSRSSVATVTVTTRSDLQLSKSDSPDPVYPGAVLTYTVRYTATGPSTAYTVVITDLLPSGVTFGGVVSAPPGLSGPTQAGQLLSWTASSLPSGSSGMIVFTVNVSMSADAQLVNTAGISSATPDPAPGNNTDTETTTVYATVDLKLQKMGSPATVAPGDALVYTVVFTNSGMFMLPSAVITDFIPSEVTISNVATSGATFALLQTTPVYVWEVTDLSAGGRALITLTTSVQTGLAAGYRFTNTATIATPLESQPSDNTGSVVTVVANAPPLAVDDGLTVAEDGIATTLVGGATTVLNNDGDANGDALTSALVTPPLYGSLTFNPGGTFSYDHNGSETTADSFVYQACDPNSLCDQATVVITITTANDAPVAMGDSMTVLEGGVATTLDGGATSVLNNDSDEETLPASLVVSLVAGTGPLYGTLNLNPDGTFSYTHDGSETIADSFMYQVCDTGTPALCATATVNIKIDPVNDPPVISTLGSVSILMNTSSGPLPFTISDADTPLAELVLTVTTSNAGLIPVSQAVLGGSGAARTLTLTPLADSAGSATIVVQVGDGQTISNMPLDVRVYKYSYVYLPLAVTPYELPDLIVSDIIATPNDISIVIQNIGPGPVPVQAFWVDVYINPHTIPTQLDQPWPLLADQGLVWTVKTFALPLDPGETVTLRINDEHYWADKSYVEWPLTVGTWIYAHVDSCGLAASPYGGIAETHEVYGGAYNNITGKQLTADMYLLPDDPLPASRQVAPDADLLESLPPRPGDID
ncbi:MAG: DUF11 domain-containing protein [Anaerolineae bacterium]|nr:DUF11 domain-containing protein [Anaerolineae bacterium]